MAPENENQKNIEYVLGIDFGHGETEAGLCSVGWGTEVGQLQLPIAVDIFPSIKVIQSVIGYDSDGRTLIGDQALLGIGNETTRLDIGWKKRPSLMDAQARKATADFMKAVYLEIRKNLPYLTDDNHCVCIGHPSGWPESESELYLKVAQDAGLANVKKTEESRAALILARSDTTSGISPDILDEGVLVCDFGSGTLDFTYCRGSERPKEDGADLGASLIDKMILTAAMEEMTPDERKEIEDIFADNPSMKVLCELKARDVKVQYYQRGEKYPHKDGLLIRKRPPLYLEIKVNSELMASLLGTPENGVPVKEHYIHQVKVGDGGDEVTGSWREILRATLNHAHSKLIRPTGNALSAALLTGGASRMSFISEDIMAILRRDLLVAKDQDPSTAIARGIAYVGRADLRTREMAEECSRKVIETLDSQIESRIPALIAGIAKKATDVIVEDVVFPELRRWRDREVWYLSTTETNIKKHAEERLQGQTFRREIGVVVAAWLQGVMKECVMPQLKSVLESYGYQGKVSEIKVEEELAPSASGISVDTEKWGEIIDVSEVIGAIVGIVILAIGHILNIIVAFSVWLIMIYVVASILLAIGVTGPFALLLYAGAAALAWKLATKGGNLTNEIGGAAARLIGGDVREKDYSVKRRQKIFEKFLENKSEMLKNIADKIEEQLQLDGNLSAQAKNIASRYADSYVKGEIKIARLLID